MGFEKTFLDEFPKNNSIEVLLKESRAKINEENSTIFRKSLEIFLKSFQKYSEQEFLKESLKKLVMKFPVKSLLKSTAE